MRFIYTAFVYLYGFAIRLAAPFNAKAKLWINGRKNIFNTIQKDFEKLSEKKIIWVHCASLGEFEQGRPVIEKIKSKEPSTIIVLTFFSPSGYEVRKNYYGANFIYYLPIDIFSNAEKFIVLIKPAATFFVKYEFWYNYLYVLKNKNIPTYLISGVFRENHYFFKWYGKWARQQLISFTHFYLQNKLSEKLLNTIGYVNTTVAGDTRFDRVFEISKSVKTIPLIEQFKQSKNILIAGSTWLDDERILSTLDFKTFNFGLIIAPHEINEEHIHAIEELFSKSSAGKCLRYSQTNKKNVTQATVLIIDNVGMLSSIYQYGTIAYIGGGFGKGIHNILEAATFGLPIIFGPNYQKFSEAVELIKLGGAFTISTNKELEDCFSSLTYPEKLSSASTISRSYISSNIGATDKILNSISSK
jgi:3-deoxy-D-manno-octulosonic-acid transferase